jgi:hypothetical protein
MNAVALGMVLAGWWGASGASSDRRQLGSVNLALGGLVVAGAANAWWLGRCRRVVVLARSAVLPLTTASPWLHPVPYGPERTEGLVVGENMTRFHRASCLLAKGKEVRPAERSEGYGPCEVCQP